MFSTLLTPPPGVNVMLIVVSNGTTVAQAAEGAKAHVTQEKTTRQEISRWHMILPLAKRR